VLLSERHVFRRGLGSASRSGHFRLGAAQPPDRVGTRTPEDGELRSLHFLGLAVLALVLGAAELSVNQDMVTLPEPLVHQM